MASAIAKGRRVLKDAVPNEMQDIGRRLWACRLALSETFTASVFMPRTKRIKKIPSKGTEPRDSNFCLFKDMPVEVLEMIVGFLPLLDLPKFLTLSKEIKVSLN